MSHAAITVENLSKAYRLGTRDEVPDTFASALVGVVRSPLRNLKKLQRLTRFAKDDDSADTLWALRDVSFEVKEGEVLGVIGRNGAGKSTLLKILSRITEPTSGRAVIRGRVSSLLEVGTGFHPDLTGRDNVYMNGTILGMRKREIDRKFDEIVEFSGVEKFLDTPVKRYSSGMSVRLAFAVAAHLEPEILIIDEVLAVGDAEFQKKCLGKMKDVARGGRTVLFVSHNFAAVESLCSNAIEMRSGQLVNNGTTSAILASYRKSISARGNATTSSIAYKHFGDVKLIDETGIETEHLPLGGIFRLKLPLDRLNGSTSVVLGIGIDDAVGQRMLTVHSPSLKLDGSLSSHTTTVICEVREFPLALGEYRVKVALSKPPQQLEAVDDILTFTVVDANAFGEGRGFHRGVCVAPSDWSLQNESSQAKSLLEGASVNKGEDLRHSE